jgi:hypothetical protein
LQAEDGGAGEPPFESLRVSGLRPYVIVGRLMPFEMDREEYARRYGPTTGDLVRLGDTDLWVGVEMDDTGYGDERHAGRRSDPRDPQDEHRHQGRPYRGPGASGEPGGQ